MNQFAQKDRLSSARSELENWGGWAKDNTISSLSYPAVELYRKLYQLPGDTVKQKPEIDSGRAEVADKFIAKLIMRDESIGVITALYYMTGMSYSELTEFMRSRGFNYGRTLIANMVDSGTSWFDGAFFSN